MQASFANYRPVEIPRPTGLLNVEICSDTGLRATPKCVETVQNSETGEQVQRRTTYFEIASEDQVPKDLCDLHGGGVRTNVRSIAAGEWPRAALAVDVAAHTPVAMLEPTVIGDSDPYNSVQSVTNALAARALTGQVAPVDSSAVVPAATPSAEGQMEVRRAEAVNASEQMALPEVPIKLDPPPPIEF
jgi:penicillin-binding protein 1A